MKVLKVTVTVAIISGVGVAGEGLGQVSDPSSEIRLVEVRAEPAEPGFGELFDLHITLRLRPDWVVFLPDTLLLADAVQSVRSGSWREVPAPGDSVEIRALYPLIGFREGRVGLPRLEFWTRAATAEPDNGTVVRRMTPVAVASPAVTRRVMPLGPIDIEPFTAMDGEMTKLAPRPPGDVLGGTWSLWLLSALGMSIMTIGATGAAILPRWWEGWGSAWWARLHGRSPRQKALRELGRIRSDRWHRSGRVDDFYASLTDTLRHFLHKTEDTWGPSLTSNEVLARIERRWGIGRIEPLTTAVTEAERVKFGGHRPEPESAEEDWERVHDWIRKTPEA